MMDAITLHTGNLEGFRVDDYFIVGIIYEADKLVIAVLGSNCDWAAYDGPRNSGTHSVVAAILHGGRKLRREEALAAFPLLNPERWRK